MSHPNFQDDSGDIGESSINFRQNEINGENSNQQQNGGSSSTGALPDIVTDSSSPSSNYVNAIDVNVQRQPSLQQKQCWVCFANEEDDPGMEWVRPCRCRGSTMWVHQKCLQRWVDEKQKGNTFAAVACSSCGFVYTILYPPSNFVVLLLEKIDRVIAKICPLMTGGIILVSLYWSAVTYGAVTFMQVMGSERGMQALEKADPIILLIGLPTIPIFLITVKMIRWEDKIVQFLRDHFMTLRNENPPRAPVAIVEADGAAAAGAADAPVVNDQAAVAQQQIIRDAASATRILCGALALPTIAVTVGKLVYGDTVGPPLRRACYGAAIFFLVRGATKIYYKYQQVLRQKNRSIIDYQHPPVPNVVQDRAAGTGEAANPVDMQP